MGSSCQMCKAHVDEWNKTCGGCGFRLVLEPEEQTRARYLRGPSLGALLFSQGWTFGARMYVWFVISLIPGVGLVVPFVMLVFGRRWSWKHGGWEDWESFRTRMRLLDLLGIIWILSLMAVYFALREVRG